MADFGPMGFGPQSCSLSWIWLLSRDPVSDWLLQQPGVPLRDTLYLGYFKAKQTATHFFFFLCALPDNLESHLLLAAHITCEK